MPRSCEDFRFKYQQFNDRVTHFNKSKIIKSFSNYYFNNNNQIGENVKIDIDGGGPLKEFQVTCLKPLFFKKLTPNNLVSININAKKKLKDKINKKILASKIESNNKNDDINKLKIDQYDYDGFINNNFENEEEENEVIIILKYVEFFKLFYLSLTKLKYF